jgi:hypothetical protein
MLNIIFQAGNERRVGYGVDSSQQALRELGQARTRSSLLVEGYQGMVQIPITSILYSVESTLVGVNGWVEWSIRLLAPQSHVEQFAQYLLSQLGMLPCSAAERDAITQCRLTKGLHLVDRCQYPHDMANVR